jgi:hypothetical protein
MPVPDWLRRHAGLVATIELWVATGIALVAGFVWLASPAYMGGFYGFDDRLLIGLAGAGLAAVGLTWMARIATSAVEGGRSFWRHR